MFLESGINKYNIFYKCNNCKKEFYCIKSKLIEIDKNDGNKRDN